MLYESMDLDEFLFEPLFKLVLEFAHGDDFGK
jgi:hypothetical protein